MTDIKRQTCIQCDTDISHKVSRAKFCSVYCKSKNWATENRDKYLMLKERGRRKNGIAEFGSDDHLDKLKARTKEESFFCKQCDKEVTMRPCEVKERKYCSRACSSLDNSGENSYNWNPNREEVEYDRRDDQRYRTWRTQVRQRDRNKCRIDNDGCSGRLETHHILAWRSHPELRYEVNNGITLCHAHHPCGGAEEKRLVPTFQELASVSIKN